KVSKKSLSASTISQIENHGKGIAFQRLVDDILPAYGIKDIGDFDLFLDYCINRSLDGIAIIRKKEEDVRQGPTGTTEYLISPQKLKGNRARISIIDI